MPEEEEQPENETPQAAAPKKSGGIKDYLIYLLPAAPFVFYLLVFVISIALVLAILKVGEASSTPDFSGLAGQVSITGPLTFPAGIDETAAANCLDSFIKSKAPSSPLASLGNVFVSSGKQYNVNPILMVAIAGQETSFATNGIAKNQPEKHNFYGKTDPGGSWHTFASWNDAIQDMARYINEQYLGQGINTVAQIQKKWAPSGAANDPTGLNNAWLNGVTKFMQQTSDTCSALKIDYNAESAYASGSTGKGDSCGLQSVSKDSITSKLSSSNLVMMPQAANDFNNLAKAFYQKTGKKLPILQMYRTNQDQTSLYNEVGGKQANVPGTSMHEAGLAIDINYKALSSQEYWIFRNMAPDYRFHIATKGGVERPYPGNECWHFDYTAFESKFWYGSPKITNAINAAHGQCSS